MKEKEENENPVESRACETGREYLEKRVHTEIARCIWRPDVDFCVGAKNESIFHTVRNSRKIISTKINVPGINCSYM